MAEEFVQEPATQQVIFVSGENVFSPARKKR